MSVRYGVGFQKTLESGGGVRYGLYSVLGMMLTKIRIREPYTLASRAQP